MNPTKFQLSNIFKAVVAGVVVLVALSLFTFDIVRVNERQVAVITRFGKVKDFKGAGWHWKVPIVDQVSAKYNLAVNSVSTVADSATKDQQTLSIKTNVQYRLNGEEADQIYQKVRDQEYLEQSIIPPIIEESVKASSAQFSLSELITDRESFKIKVIESLEDKLAEYNADLVTVNIEDIQWSPEFEASIQAKVKAEQITLQREQELEAAKVEKEIAITRAEAEADSLRIKGEAIQQNPETVELEKIKKWDGKLPTVQGGEGLIIDLND